MKKHNIILIGFMGAGKTTIGRRLSYLVKQPFLDMDQYIEMKEGREISQIFEMDGEAAFRKIETISLKKVKRDRTNYVISTGGGLPVQIDNQKILSEMGIIFYLRVKPETIFDRLKNDTKRPLLQGDDPKRKIMEMLEIRSPIYEELADYIIDVDEKSFKEIIQEIIQKLEEGVQNETISH